ncbi:IS701 family transposase [Tautonia sociabilis]|uniref:Transposase n=1 Tax=Tautonia sociabilis TaxID=2080755 RepID=A0A432MKN7_9BACT|nr:transposase [Tautonia sociabilis]RUL87971.1 transposase [Tautonia sociabilis]
MFAITLTAQWAAWVAALAAPLHRRCAWRLAPVVAGILMASGRRTASSWWRAAGIGRAFRSYYYFLDHLGRKVTQVATVLLGLVLGRIAPEERLLLAIDDTPTKRYGPEVQGAGVHHNPTPGPAGSKFLYGHSWVVLSRIVHHHQGGVVGLPLLGRLYIRDRDIPDLPDEVEWDFRTKPQLAAELIGWAGGRIADPGRRPWVAVDGAYGNREFLKPAKRAGFVVVARLRRDADLSDLPPPLKPGQKRGRGRPPIYGKGSISLAKRAGQRRGWQEVRASTIRGREVIRMAKSFLATWRPAGGTIRVVIVEEPDGEWRAYLCTDPGASVEAIVQAIHDRWAIEQGFADLKEVEGIEQVQLRRVWSNVGALNLNLWVHTLVEVWAWGRPAEEVRDRRDRPWDDPDRRPSHADRRKALQRSMVEEEFRRVRLPLPWSEKIRPLLEGVVRMVA